MLHPSQMLFVGMDIHKDNHAAIAADCFGQVYLEQEITNRYQDFQKLAQSIRAIASSKQLTPVLVSREREHMTHPEKSDLQDAKGVVYVLKELFSSYHA